MASVNKDSKGWRVEFTLPGQKRKPLRLGKATSEKAAREIGRHIERIIEAKKTGLPLAADTEKWLHGLPEMKRRQLVSLGLIADAGQRMSRSLGGFLDEYIRNRSDIEASTKTNLETARRWLVEYFGGDRELDSISPGEADEYRAWLASKAKQAANTVKRLCSRAKQFFRAAVRRRLVRENPFQDMKHLIVGASPKSRVRFIDEPTASLVLAACPDAHWRAIFALARYGGFRVPSEICSLRWTDIDWENGRIHVNCQKTKGIEGKEFRFTPLFPELRRELEAWRKKALQDREFVLKPAISPKTNLRTGLLKILKRAGIKSWPKLYQNLRSTRSTELITQGFPAHVVAAWLGHTVKVANAHYNQITDEHFRRAVDPDGKKEPPAHGAA
jgi:integrase